MKKITAVTARNVSRILGGSILVSAMMACDQPTWDQARYLVTGMLHGPELVFTAIGLLMIMACLVGGAVLLLGQRWGYYCIYASFLPAILMRISFIPYLYRAVGMWTDYHNTALLFATLLLANLGITGILFWMHRIVRRTAA